MRENGISAYTIIGKVMGKSLTGRVDGAFLPSDIISISFSVLPFKQARLSTRLRRFIQQKVKGNRSLTRYILHLVKNTCRARSFLVSGWSRRSFKNN